MMDLNKVMLIGRLTRDPEVKEFAGGGKVANIGFAVHNRRKNRESGQWEEVPVWVNLKAFNRKTGRQLADLAANHLHKGNRVYVEGHLALEEWTGKEDGLKKSRMMIYVDEIGFLDGGKPGQAGRGGSGGAGAEAEVEEEAFDE